MGSLQDEEMVIKMIKVLSILKYYCKGYVSDKVNAIMSLYSGSFCI